MKPETGASRLYCTFIALVANTALTRFSIFAGIAVLQHLPVLWRRIPPLYLSDVARPATRNQDYAAPRLRRRVADEDPRVERWYIESPAMRRIVEVQIQLPQQPETPAPMLYLLDGLSAPRRSGWLREGQLSRAFDTENVMVVMPTEASGSLYEDWYQEDVILGRNQWETFLINELPTILENPQQGLNLNGKRLIAGLSMGASAAVRLAARNHEFFHGVIGLSGCYSTTSLMGRGMTLAIIRGVGGDPDNVWPPANRMLADVTRNPEGLRTMPVYLFAADGIVTTFDINNHIGKPKVELPGAVLLEYASYLCTKELDRAMRQAGMTHQVVCYQRGGVHAWAYYGEQLKRGWAAVYQPPVSPPKQS